MGDFFILILCTVVSDFIIQNKTTVDLRKATVVKESIEGHKRHFIEVFIPLIICLIVVSKDFLLSIIISLVLSLIHIIIDFIKCSISKRKIINEIVLFLLDQSIHIISTYIIWSIFDFKYETMLIYNLNLDINSIKYILVFIIILTYVVYGGCIFVDLIMSSIPNQSKSNSELSNDKLDIIMNLDELECETYGACVLMKNIVQSKTIEQELELASAAEQDQANNKKNSEYVGMLERVIVFILIINNGYSGLGLIITGKSIARFDNFKDKNFADRYILGTFLSISIAMIGAMIFKGII